MSYAQGMGIAVPSFRGVTARGVTSRGVTVRGVTARRGSLGSFLSGLGASVLVAASPGVAQAGVAGAATNAVNAIMTASPAQLRTPIIQVRTFQEAYGHGLTVDGLYGPATRAALASVTGRTDLPAAGASSGGTSSPYVPAPVPEALVTDTSTTFSPSPTAQSWLVPVAVVSTLVLVAGVVYMRRPVRANRRRR